MRKTITFNYFPYDLAEEFICICEELYNEVLHMLNITDKVSRFRARCHCVEYAVFLAYIFSDKKKHRIELLIDTDELKNKEDIILISHFTIQEFIDVYEGRIEPFYIINDGIKYEDSDTKTPHEKAIDLLFDYLYLTIRDSYEERGQLHILNGPRFKASRLHIWKVSQKYINKAMTSIEEICKQL